MYSEQELKTWKAELDEQAKKLEARQKAFKTKDSLPDVRAGLNNLAEDIQKQIDYLERGKLFDEKGTLNFVGRSDNKGIKETLDNLDEFLDEAWDIESSRKNLEDDREEYEDAVRDAHGAHRMAVKQAMRRI